MTTKYKVKEPFPVDPNAPVVKHNGLPDCMGHIRMVTIDEISKEFGVDVSDMVRPHLPPTIIELTSIEPPHTTFIEKQKLGRVTPREQRNRERFMKRSK